VGGFYDRVVCWGAAFLQDAAQQQEFKQRLLDNKSAAAAMLVDYVSTISAAPATAPTLTRLVDLAHAHRTFIDIVRGNCENKMNIDCILSQWPLLHMCPTLAAFTLALRLFADYLVHLGELVLLGKLEAYVNGDRLFFYGAGRPGVFQPPP
jgi:hypothetical protein